MTEIDGTIEVVRAGTDQPVVVRVTHKDTYDTPIKLTPQHELLVANGDEVTDGQLLARIGEGADLVEVKSPAAGRVTKKGSTLTLHSEDVDSREYQVPHSARLRVETGDEVLAGHPLTELAEPEGPPPDQGRGHGPALPGDGGAEGVPLAGRLDRRQARRDHRAADAAQGHRRRGRRHRAARAS